MYGDAGSYGGLAGFGGPALGGVDAPVVRYQDLMRTSAPASAGVPEFGRIVQDGAQGFGAEPLPLPVLGGYAGNYGAGYTLRARPTLEEVATYPTLAKGDAGDRVKELQQLLVNKTFLTEAAFGEGRRYFGTFGPKTEEVLKDNVSSSMMLGGYDAAAARNGRADSEVFAFLWDIPKQTEREQAEQAEREQAEKKGGKKKSAWEQALIGAGKRSGFITSGKEEAPKEEVSKDGDQTGTDWGKIALIGGGVLVGITSIVLITRALSDKE